MTKKVWLIVAAIVVVSSIGTLSFFLVLANSRISKLETILLQTDNRTAAFEAKIPSPIVLLDEHNLKVFEGGGMTQFTLNAPSAGRLHVELSGGIFVPSKMGNTVIIFYPVVDPQSNVYPFLQVLMTTNHETTFDVPAGPIGVRLEGSGIPESMAIGLSLKVTFTPSSPQ